MTINIGIIGHGFVGKAVSYGFNTANVSQHIIDPRYGNDTSDLPACDAVFVCVPTPMSEDGSIDSSIIDSVMLSLVSRLSDFRVIVIKSTITPDIAKKWAIDDVVFNPEFLKEKSANEDFVNPEFHLFGGHKPYTTILKQIYEDYSLCKPCPAFEVSHAEASIIKYAINSFLSLKVTFFNQLNDLVEEENCNFAKIVKVVGSDKRIGASHSLVPGHDGKKGFGGACFPKDTSALVNYTDKMSLIAKVIEINNAYRSKYEKDDREKEQNISFK